MRQLVNPKTFGRPYISLARVGCANRPFFHITVFPDKALGRHWEGNVIEQIGSFDPLPNDRNEKLVALNIERIKYWLGVRSAHVSTPVLELLGLAGLLPLHPKTYLRARINRIQLNEANASKQAAQASLQQIGAEDDLDESEQDGQQQQQQVEGSDETGGGEKTEEKEEQIDSSN